MTSGLPAPCVPQCKQMETSDQLDLIFDFDTLQIDCSYVVVYRDKHASHLRVVGS